MMVSSDPLQWHQGFCGPRNAGVGPEGGAGFCPRIQLFFAPTLYHSKVCAMLLQPFQGLRLRSSTVVRLAGVALCLEIMVTMRPAHAFAVVQPFATGQGWHVTTHSGHLHLLRPAPFRPNTKRSLSNNNVGILNRRTRLFAFEDGLVDSYRNMTVDRLDPSALEKQKESRSLMKFLDSAEQRIERMEKKFAAKADKRLHKLRRKLVRRLERMEGTLDRVRPGIQRIVSSPKLMVLALATCLVAVPASTMAFSVVATVFQVQQSLAPIPAVATILQVHLSLASTPIQSPNRPPPHP
jgi:hypothetical protein